MHAEKQTDGRMDSAKRIGKILRLTKTRLELFFTLYYVRIFTENICRILPQLLNRCVFTDNYFNNYIFVLRFRIKQTLTL
jgi:hypothetical protein